MFIETQATPNPATVKFIPDQKILETGNIDFPSLSSAKKSPLAMRLFGITGVVRVFLSTNFVSITKADNTDWSMLKPMILAALMEHLSVGQNIIDADYYDITPQNNNVDDEVVSQIKELLEERVRPMVAMDGGDIVFDRFEQGIVYLRMQGACAGCPSSTATLKIGIENMLRHYIPEVIEVRAA